MQWKSSAAKRLHIQKSFFRRPKKVSRTWKSTLRDLWSCRKRACVGACTHNLYIERVCVCVWARTSRRERESVCVRCLRGNTVVRLKYLSKASLEHLKGLSKGNKKKLLAAVVKVNSCCCSYFFRTSEDLEVRVHLWSLIGKETSN